MRIAILTYDNKNKEPELFDNLADAEQKQKQTNKKTTIHVKNMRITFEKY